MPRIPRAFVDGFIYHVSNRGNGKRNVFHKAEDFQTFANLLRLGKGLYSIKVLAYCLMPNHFHVVAWPSKAEDLSKWMQWLMTIHVRRYHQVYSTNGHVWHGRFKSFIVQQDDHLLTLMKYVESNPLRWGLVHSSREWKWSSYVETIENKSKEIEHLSTLSLPDDWGTYVDAPLTEEELERLRQSVNRQSPYGSLNWQLKVSTEFGLESTLRPRGRPRNGGNLSFSH